MSANRTATRAAKPGQRNIAAASSGPASDADGRAGIKAWLTGITPGQRRLAQRIDALIVRALPDAVSAIKYRKPSQPLGVPFYGLRGKSWVVHVNSLKGRVRLTFFAGGGLTPVPPLPSPRGARAIDIPSEREVDEKQITAWLRQAAKLPGWGRVG